MLLWVQLVMLLLRRECQIESVLVGLAGDACVVSVKSSQCSLAQLVMLVL